MATPPPTGVSAAAPGAAGTPWFEAEPSLGATARRAIRRLVHRARFSWPLSLTLALGLSAAFTLWRARTPTTYEVTVVLRAVAGDVGGNAADLGTGALRARIFNLVFTNGALMDLMHRHPDEFRGVDRDPTLALDSMREQIDLAVEGNDLSERSADDPPPSARIALTYRGADPQLTLLLARELADMVVTSTVQQQRQAAERNLAAATTGLTGAKNTASSLSAQGLDPYDLRMRSAAERLRLTRAEASAAQLDARAAEEQQALHFDRVDPGELPRPATRRSLLIGFVLAFFGGLAAVWLLAGAFDPRVLDTEDLDGLGLVPLGHVPPLPTGAAVRKRAHTPGVGEASTPRV